MKNISEFNAIESPPSSLKISFKSSSNEKGVVFENTDVLDKIDKEYNMKKASILERKRAK